MSRYAIDAPTLLHALTSGRAIDTSHQLVAPNAIRSHVLDLLLARVRAGELTDKDAMALHTLATETKMRLLGDRVSRQTAWKIARERDWDSTTAAEYLAVAKLQADAFVTIDKTLAKVAKDVTRVEKVDVLFRR